MRDARFELEAQEPYYWLVSEPTVLPFRVVFMDAEQVGNQIGPRRNGTELFGSAHERIALTQAVGEQRSSATCVCLLQCSTFMG